MILLMMKRIDTCSTIVLSLCNHCQIKKKRTFFKHSQSARKTKKKTGMKKYSSILFTMFMLGCVRNSITLNFLLTSAIFFFPK